MGKCKYCGKDAGFFKSKHPACEERHTAGCARLEAILTECFDTKTDFYTRRGEVRALFGNSFFDSDDMTRIYVGALDRAVERYLDDGLVDAEEERMVARFMQFSELSQQVLNANRSLEKVVQSKVLMELLNGRIPKPNITITGDFPFLLSKNENILWMFRGITLLQQKVRREYRGRSSGVSMRVCKGVYYRTGGFRGTPVETSYMAHIGTGSVCLTDKNLYFHSPEKSLKIPISKILSLEPYSNGLGLQKDGANDKPMFFENLNSWFCYNAITNLKQ